MDDVLKLLAFTVTRDKYGVERKTYTERETFCKLNSVTRNGFAAAGQIGLHPEMVFDVAAVEYNGETEIEFHGKRYSVYRTYRSAGSDYIELYTERKAANGN